MFEEMKEVLLKDPKCKAMWDELESCLPTDSEIDSYVQDDPEEVLRNLKEKFLDAEEATLECTKLKLKVILTIEALTDDNDIEQSRLILSKQVLDQYQRVQKLKQVLKMEEE